MATSRLTTSVYVPPGVYLGRKFIPRPSPPTANPRKVALIGRGSRLKNILDTEITRSKVFDENLTFLQVGGGGPDEASLFEAQLIHRANLDKVAAILVKSNGEVVGPANWQLVEATDSEGTGLGYAQSIQIRASAFIRDVQYKFTYQSIDRNILDPVPWNPPLEMRAFLFSGEQPGTDQFQEFQDFVVTMEATTPFDLTDPNSSAGSLLATLKTLTPPVTDPGLSLAEFVVNIANHSAGTYRFDIVVVTPSTPVLDGSIEYSLSFKPFGTFVFNPIGNFTAVIPATAPGADPITVVVDDQLTTKITKSDTNALVAGEFFLLTVQPFAELAYHPDFFDTEGRPKYTSKDTRTIDFTIARIVKKDGTESPFPLVEPDLIEYTFTSSTQEGGFGVFTIERSGTAGSAGSITAPTKASISSINSSAYIAFNGDTIFIIIDRSTTQVITLSGVTDGAATVAELISTINAQIQGGTAFADGTKIAVRNDTPGANHQIQIIGGTAIAPAKIDFSDTEASGDDAILAEATGDFGQIFTGRNIVITGAVNADNNGTFSIVSVDPSLTSIKIRNNDAITETPVNWQIVSPEPNFNRAPFRDGIIFLVNEPDNAAVGQKTILTITNKHQIDWSLVRERTEIFDPTMIFTDRVGRVTGVAAARYVLTAEVPSIDTSHPLTVKNQSGSTMFTITDPDDERLRRNANGELTAIVRIPNYNENTDKDLTIIYSSRGAEPSPGEVYFFSSAVLRPDTDYNTVVDFFSPDEAANFLAPSQVDNHLFIATRIAFDQRPSPRILSILQVRDLDEDGIFTNEDFKIAIDASFGDSDITDRVVLSNFGSMLDAKAITIAANDPFVKKWALQWNGMPVNAKIGSDKEPNSIVYTAKKTLQVQGDNQARGAFILIANRFAKKTIQLDDGTRQQVTLDGSFLSAAGAALTSGFATPERTILRQKVNSFDDIETFSDTDLLRVGAASTTFIQKQGNDFIWGESVTVDQTEPALNEISGRTQEQFVSRFMVREVDRALVGLIADSPADLAAITQSFIADALLSLFSQGFIAQWTNDDGTPRQFNSTEDVQAEVDNDEPRTVFFNFWYNVRFPAKRFQGLYSVGRNLFKTQTPS